MRFLFLIWCFYLALIPTGVFAGNNLTPYTNKVIDATSNKPIPFVNIGVLHKGIGTVSDEQGNFTLDFTGAIITDTVKFSCIGYEDLIFSVEQLQFRTTPIPLRPKQTVLSTVIVKPKFYKSLKLGVITDTDIVTGGFSSNDLGSELATVLPYNKKQTAHLKKVYISVAESGYDSVFFRINVYAVKKGAPADNILKQPIYVTSGVKQGVIEVNMADYDITFNQPIAISIEWLKDLGKGNLFFSCKLFKGQSFARKTSQAGWEKAPVGVGLWADVDYEYK